MSELRVLLVGGTLLGLLALLFYTQQQRIKVAELKAASAEARAEIHLANATTLQEALSTERSAQTRLRATHDQLRHSLAQRELHIETLHNENADLRNWARQPLPAAARRLRERPALTGAEAYRQWLPRRDTVPPASRPAEQ